MRSAIALLNEQLDSYGGCMTLGTSSTHNSSLISSGARTACPDSALQLANVEKMTAYGKRGMRRIVMQMDARGGNEETKTAQDA